MDTVKAGEPAPDFALAEDGGAEGATLSRLRGRPVVVYFYPKDDTPGCTAEARDFSCVLDEFDKAEVHVIGISPDTVRSHVKFRDKHELKVRLASDEDTTIARAYGVWVQKQMYGRTFMGVERATFLIDREGRVARIWRNVRVPGHVDDVLAAVRSLQ
jgi:thioredoxin-dependent peroxiredoxin